MSAASPVIRISRKVQAAISCICLTAHRLISKATSLRVRAKPRPATTQEALRFECPAPACSSNACMGIFPMLNKAVRYESTRTAGRYFVGQVVRLYEDRAIVRHTSEPRHVTIPLYRLEVVERPRFRFSGHAA